MPDAVPQRTIRLFFSTTSESLEINGGGEKQLEVDFAILQKLTPDANQARILISNLAPASRGWLQSKVQRSLNVANSTVRPDGSTPNPGSLGSRPVAKEEVQRRSDVFVEIEAGYDRRTGILFEGSCQRAFDRNSSVTWQTDISVGDALANQMGAVVARQFAPKSRLLDAIVHMIKVMGLGNGNVTSATLDRAMGRGVKTLPLGLTAVGKAKDYITNILNLSQAQWFVDQGMVYIVPGGEPLNQPELLLSPDTGMVGRPMAIEGGGVMARSMIRTDIRIGRKVRVDSSTVQGVYRCDVIQSRGNNRRGLFETAYTLQAIQPVLGIAAA